MFYKWDPETSQENSQYLYLYGGNFSICTRAQVLHDVVHGAVGDINIPGKHAFLFERILEFNASVPYAGFSGAFLEQMNRPGRFDKEARRRAFDTMEALFCLLPEAKKVRSQINPVAYKTAGICLLYTSDAADE